MKYYYIYKITNTTNGKIYIGKRHGPLNERYYGSGTFIKRAIAKYGIGSFDKEIFLISNKDSINEYERKCIAAYNCKLNEGGYNFADGGDGGDSYMGRSWKEVSTKEVYLSRVERKRQWDCEFWTEDNRKMLGNRVKELQWSGEKGELRRRDFSKRYSGENNPSAKQYKIITNTGEVIFIKSLATFCKQRGLKTWTVRQCVNNGKIIRKSIKDTSFFRSAAKRAVEGWEIIEITNCEE